MASSCSRLRLIRRLLLRTPLLSSPSSSLLRPSLLLEAPAAAGLGGDGVFPSCRSPNRGPISRSLFSSLVDGAQGPTAVDYRSLLSEDEFHRLADEMIHDLQEKIEEFGDTIQIDGFDIDYGSQVLTLKLGSLGTYVINKQTPNRQIWLSSPVSGPSRFDWDGSSKAWVYRRTKENLLQLLENELEKLCGKPIQLT